MSFSIWALSISSWTALPFDEPAVSAPPSAMLVEPTISIPVMPLSAWPGISQRIV